MLNVNESGSGDNVLIGYHSAFDVYLMNGLIVSWFIVNDEVRYGRTSTEIFVLFCRVLSCLVLEGFLLLHDTLEWQVQYCFVPSVVSSLFPGFSFALFVARVSFPRLLLVLVCLLSCGSKEHHPLHLEEIPHFLECVFPLTPPWLARDQQLQLTLQRLKCDLPP
jgi:hypothetical protein